MKEQILVVDDDHDILELLEYNLHLAGYDVIGFLSTKGVREVLKQENIDLIIMDRNLPDIEGSYYVEMLRSKGINIPVILLSAKDTTEDIKDGLIKGADDYVTKPFDLDELILRIKIILKRTNKESKELKKTILHKDMKVDLNMHMVSIEGIDILLSNLDISLLKIFILNKGKVLDREFLLQHVWKDTHNTHKKTVNVAIKRLKEKIDPLKRKEYIQAVRGVGYILN